MGPLLQIRGLTVSFHTDEASVTALEQVSLDIGRGETFGLVGETGCGKTLTALSILALLPPQGRIEGGSILFHRKEGEKPLELLALGEEALRAVRGRDISMIFQEPSIALNPVYTIGEQITEVILLHRLREASQNALESVESSLSSRKSAVAHLLRPLWLLERALYRKMSGDAPSLAVRLLRQAPLARRFLWRLDYEARQMVIDLLAGLEMPDSRNLARRYPHEISVGMRQRAVIAMALACSPQLLIADEPTTALDVTVQAQILGLLRRWKAERGSSILFITHDLAVAAGMCDRVGVMHSGSLYEVAEVRELFASPRHPYTKLLLEAAIRPGIKLKLARQAVPNLTEAPPGCRFHPHCPDASAICQEQPPVMREVASGHTVACHFAGGTNG